MYRSCGGGAVSTRGFSYSPSPSFLDGKTVDYPLSRANVTFKRAPRAKGQGSGAAQD